jgi:hypothetical protein
MQKKRPAEKTSTKEGKVNETITYAGAIWMIGGWVAGRIIATFIINRMDKDDVG